MDRRGFFALLGILGSMPILSKFAHGSPKKLSFGDLRKEAKVNVVYHADFGQEKRFMGMLRNIRNHLSVYTSGEKLTEHIAFSEKAITYSISIKVRQEGYTFSPPANMIENLYLRVYPFHNLPYGFFFFAFAYLHMLASPIPFVPYYLKILY